MIYIVKSADPNVNATRLDVCLTANEAVVVKSNRRAIAPQSNPRVVSISPTDHLLIRDTPVIIEFHV
jgi:hypothetical protein